MKTKVTLLSWTKDPLRTLWKIWICSREQVSLESMHIPEADGEQLLFQRIVDSDIPVAEHISFTFLLEGVSIALREQLVRHRIGCKVGDNFGVDIIPELSSSTFWAQSMRILDMSSFEYEIPDSVVEAGQEVYFKNAMARARNFYSYLVGRGVPLEDARMVIPLAATHRITWTLNLASIARILKKRGCWILQLGLWEPVIRGIVEGLATKIDPCFRQLIRPPCWDSKDCCFKLDNEQRLNGNDPLPFCPLWCRFHGLPYQEIIRAQKIFSKRKLKLYQEMCQKFSNLWGFPVGEVCDVKDPSSQAG